jgi:hypothetical protein
MGECDRYKNYISDYLDNTLDPTTHKEFEKALKNSADLQKMTNKVSQLRVQLKKLSYQTCSDDFSLKLRERIHTKPEPLISKKNVVRLSFAFSFVAIIAFTTFSLTNFLDSTEMDVPIQKNSGYQDQSPVPSSNPTSSTNNSAFENDGEIEVNIKSSQDALKDSSRTKLSKNPDSRKKQVDQQK